MNVSSEQDLFNNLIFLYSELYQDTYFNYSTVEQLNIVNITKAHKDTSIFEGLSPDSNTTNATNDLSSKSKKLRHLQDLNGDDGDVDNITNIDNSGLDPLFATMIKKYTYFAGLRVTTNNALMQENVVDVHKNVLPTQRKYVFSDPTAPIDQNHVNKTLPGYNYTPNGGYMRQGGFVQYFPSN
jgi:hypothetical protein